MKPHPIAHRIYLRIKAQLTENLPPSAHDLILQAANITEQRIDESLKLCIKKGLTHTEAERHIMNLFEQSKKLAEQRINIVLHNSTIETSATGKENVSQNEMRGG